MYKIDIKETLYPIQIVLVVYKKFSKTSVFIDRKWPILALDEGSKMVQVNTFSSGNHMSRLVVLIAISLINVHKSIPKGRHIFF